MRLDYTVYLGQYALLPPQIVLKFLNLLTEILDELDRNAGELLLRHSLSRMNQEWTSRLSMQASKISRRLIGGSNFLETFPLGESGTD